MNPGQSSARDAVMTLGRYTLCGEIAAGGMASVYFARMEGTGGFAKSVAMKRLHPQFARDPDFRTMILDEARLAARIRHPNVVSPIDVVDLQDEVLLAMEYVHGQALSRLIRASVAAREKVPPAICASVMSGMLHGLHAAHEARDDRGNRLDIVHRDISPHNVIVGIDGITRVIDFGIAKAKTSSEATQAGMVKGKVPYLAPEQLDGRQASVRTDVYAAALVFWETLVGKRVFEADYDHATVALILRGRIDPPSAYVDVSPEVDEVVLRGMSRDPDERFATAREMALALEQVMQLANPSVVGAWVERLARDDLKKRADKLARLEALPGISPDDLAMSLSSSRRQVHTLDPRSSAPRPPPASAPPAPPAAPASTRSRTPPPFHPQSTRTSQVPAPPPPRPLPPHPTAAHHSPPPPRAVPPTMPSMTDPSYRSTAPSLGFVQDAPKPPPPGTLRGPEIQMANVGWIPPNVSVADARGVTEKPRRVGGGIFALAFLLLGLAGLAVFLPGFLRDGYVKEAQKKGLVVTVGKVVLSPKAISLIDVAGTIPEVPGLSFTVPEVRLELRGLDTDVVVLERPVFTLDGSYADVDLALEQWQKTKLFPSPAPGAEPPGGRLSKVTVNDAKVTWKAPLGKGTLATFENVNGGFSAEPESTWPQHYAFVASLVKLGPEKNLFGPYELKATREMEERSLTLRLDPYGSTGAEVGMNTHAGGKREIAFRVPRRPLADLHVPEAFFGGLATKDTRAELVGDLAFTQDPKPHAEGKLRLAATALRMGIQGAPMDAELDAQLVGQGDGALEVAQGSSVSLGPVRTKLVGGVDYRGNGFRVDVSSKRCDVPTEGPQGTSRLVLPAVDMAQGTLYVAPCFGKVGK